MIIDWMDTNTCKRVETFASQFSMAFPLQVPRRLKHTFPQAYKLGLNLICPLPVVVRLTFGGALGYVS